MMKIEDKGIKSFTSKEEEIIEKIVKEDHAFRKLNKIINFEKPIFPYRKLYSDTGAEGINVVKGFKASPIRFREDYSDREMEKVSEENAAVEWFRGFALLEKTPDRGYFGKLRKRSGTENVAEIFNAVNRESRSKGMFGDVFEFIDASAIVTKTALREERDKALKDGEEKPNNANVAHYAADKEARRGAKSKTDIRFGCKRHRSVDMRFGLIDKLAATPADVLDFQALKNICPKNRTIFMDKLHDIKKSYSILKAHSCSSGIIMKNNNRRKNKGLDSWRSKTRMPFEGNFSKPRKRAKFRGRIKVLFRCFSEAICRNLKKAVSVSRLETDGI